MMEAFTLPQITMAGYNYYRVSDWVVLACVVAAVLFCLEQAAVLVFGKPAHGGHEESSRRDLDEEMDRHGLFQRIFHWMNSVSVLILVVSGWLIYAPGLWIFSRLGSTATFFSVHTWGVGLFLVGLVCHIVGEGLISQEENPMVLNRSMIEKLFAKVKTKPAQKYETEQIFYHWALAANFLAVILTGFMIWKPFRAFMPLALLGENLSWDLVYYSRWLHGFFSATLTACLIIHFYFVFISLGELKSMFTGKITVREYLKMHSLEE